MDARPMRVIYADDSWFMRQAFTQVIAQCDDVDLLAVYEDGAAALAAVNGGDVDVVVTDLRMPPSGDREGLRVAQALRESHPQIGVVVLTQHAEARHGLDLLESGPSGRAYLLKDRVQHVGVIQAAIQAVAHGGSMFDPDMVSALVGRRELSGPGLDALTPRELQVLSEMAQGKSNALIAESLVVTKKAVEKHISAIFTKLGLPSEEVASRRVAAVLRYLEGSPHPD